jgi:DNA-binding beta-propeller fold protein YncE
MDLALHGKNLTRLAGLVTAVLLASCAVAPPEKSAPSFKGPLVWPQLPDQPRFAYETVLRSPADLAAPESDRDRMIRELSGMPGASDRPVFEKAAAIAARRGRIYVADTSTESIVVFDVPRRKLFRFGQREPNTLGKPSGLALDGESNVYVADAKRRQIMVFDSLGLFLRAIGGPADLERPTGVAVSRDGERIYAVDRSDNESDNHRVVIYAKDGTKVKVVGTRGSGEGDFNVPLQATVAPDGNLYVLDSGNFRVQAFDRDGKFLHAFGKAGINPGNLARPRGIAADDDSNIYITDASFNNFQIFKSDGQLLLAVGEGSLQNNPGQFGLLSGIAADETGRVYAVDQLFNKVEVFRRLSDEDGQKLVQQARK